MEKKNSQVLDEILRYSWSLQLFLLIMIKNFLKCTLLEQKMGIKGLLIQSLNLSRHSGLAQKRIALLS